MAARFVELDHQVTPRGEVSLRRRHDPVLDAEVHEVLLGDEYLMSSAFTVAEQELARLGLAAVLDQGPLDVVVGGLGLGYTAVTALEDPRVRSLRVVDVFAPVVDWHERRLLPTSSVLLDDPRAELVTADFFAGLTDAAVWGGSGPADAVLLDVDHSPRRLLHPDHGVLYTPDGLAALAGRLRPGGVFALWSDDPPEGPFLEDLRGPFPGAVAHTVAFDNPYTGGTSANTVYVGVRPSGQSA